MRRRVVRRPGAAGGARRLTVEHTVHRGGPLRPSQLDVAHLNCVSGVVGIPGQPVIPAAHRPRSPQLPVPCSTTSSGGPSASWAASLRRPRAGRTRARWARRWRSGPGSRRRHQGDEVEQLVARATPGLEDEQPVDHRGEALGPEPRRGQPLLGDRACCGAARGRARRAGRGSGRGPRRRSR